MREAPRQVLTIEEVATVLRLSSKSVRDACRRGEIRALKVGREWRIARSVLDDLLNN